MDLYEQYYGHPVKIFGAAETIEKESQRSFISVLKELEEELNRDGNVSGGNECFDLDVDVGDDNDNIKKSQDNLVIDFEGGNDENNEKNIDITFSDGENVEIIFNDE